MFAATLNQMIFLLVFLAAGYAMAKTGYLPSGAAKVLSRLENMIFLPALVLGNFITNFTVKVIRSEWQTLLISLGIEIIVIPLAILSARLCAKDSFTRRIYTYGLAFSNFGFMGNAVVSALFPDYFFTYLIFTLPLWMCIYLWGVPYLLMKHEGGRGVREALRPLLNPMLIAMLIGAVIGLSGLAMPSAVTTIIDAAGSCMSPVAMLLTGITVAEGKLGVILRRKSIYAVTLLRLVVFPLVFVLVEWALSHWIEIPQAIAVCALCSLAMPLGLNTVVVPSAYGEDTSDAAGMALVSHVLSLVTIPILFTFCL